MYNKFLHFTCLDKYNVLKINILLLLSPSGLFYEIKHKYNFLIYI